jgi:hypothetical protein
MVLINIHKINDSKILIIGVHQLKAKKPLIKKIKEAAPPINRMLSNAGVLSKEVMLLVNVANPPYNKARPMMYMYIDLNVLN